MDYVLSRGGLKLDWMRVELDCVIGGNLSDPLMNMINKYDFKNYYPYYDLF